MILLAVLFVSFVVNLRYKCITCTVHQTVISTEHLAIARTEFLNLFASFDNKDGATQTDYEIELGDMKKVASNADGEETGEAVEEEEWEL